MAVKDQKFQQERDLFQMLSASGELLGNNSRSLSKDVLTKLYTQMLAAREFDQKAIHLQRQGRIGTYASYKGQEACQIAGGGALEPGDWLFPTYRDHGATFAHGQDWFRILLYWMGHPEGSISPKDRNIMPQAVPIATQMVHAVGTGWADKLNGRRNVSLAYFGDGATSEGDFHEALNFAGVFQTPTVFFCQNNGYAISVPFEKQSSSQTISQRAAAYDIPGIRIDGNDIIACYHTVLDAVERARNGGGPTLIEAVTTRYESHTTADDAKKYRDQETIQTEWTEKLDPLKRMRLYLEIEGFWSEDKEQEALKNIHLQLDEAVQKAESYPKPTWESMFEHVYLNHSWMADQQKRERGE